MLSRSLLPLCVLALAAATPAVVGPPTICIPLDIGQAKSIPFGKNAFELDKAYRIEKSLLADTMGVLGESRDAEVHFETLRRATLYLQSKSHAKRANLKSANKLAGDLHVALRSRLIDVTAEPRSTPRMQALAWFDLGLYELNLQILGLPRVGKKWSYLEKAGRMLPEDPGLSMALFATGYSQKKPGWWKPHLARALSSPETLSTRTRKNLLAMSSRFLNVKDMTSLQRDYGPVQSVKKR